MNESLSRADVLAIAFGIIFLYINVAGFVYALLPPYMKKDDNARTGCGVGSAFWPIWGVAIAIYHGARLGMYLGASIRRKVEFARFYRGERNSNPDDEHELPKATIVRSTSTWD